MLLCAAQIIRHHPYEADQFTFRSIFVHINTIVLRNNCYPKERISKRVFKLLKGI